MKVQAKARILSDAISRFIHDHHSTLPATDEVVLREFMGDMDKIAHAPEEVAEEMELEPTIAAAAAAATPVPAPEPLPTPAYTPAKTRKK